MFRFRNDDVKNVLAVFVPISFIGFVIVWTFFAPKLDATTLGFLNTLLGLHAGWAAMIIGYYFNSSASSARQQEIIAASSPPRNEAVVSDPEVVKPAVPIPPVAKVPLPSPLPRTDPAP